MRTTTRHRRKALALAILCAGGLAAFGVHAGAEGAADGDVYAVRGDLDSATTITTSLATFSYNVDTDMSCAVVQVPSPVSTSVAGFVDLSGHEGGACTSVSGTGSFTLAECSTGLISADWQLTEPTTGTAATFNGTGVMIGGVTVMAAPPTAGMGYTDDGSTGVGALVGLALPENMACGKTNQLFITAVVAGAY